MSGDERKRVVVVGASSGLGRCIGAGLAARGAKVALLARRKERLEDTAREAGPDAVAIACDVTEETSCRDGIEEAARALGGIDGMVYASGIGPLGRIAEVDVATWQRMFDTNVIGASIATAAALPHLTESEGTAAYLSSTSAAFTPPWPGLGAYTVTKAALDKLVEAWRAEHPRVGFTRVTVGDCGGGEGDSMSEFPKDWDMDLAAEVAEIWVNRQYLAGTLIDVEDLIGVIDAVLRCGPSAVVPTVAVLPRPAG